MIDSSVEEGCEMEEQFCNNCKRSVSAANFATHSAFCERNVKVCKLCNEPVKIDEEKQHLEEFHIVAKCDLCQIGIEKWLLPKHQLDLCSKRRILCEYCDAQVPFDKFEDHFEFCSSRTEKCIVCQKYVMLRDKKQHTELHALKHRICHGNAENEVKQNIINEVISSSNVSSQNAPEKLHQTGNYRKSFEQAMSRNDTRHHRNETSMEASAGASAKSNRHFGNETSIEASACALPKSSRHFGNDTPIEASACAPDKSSRYFGNEASMEASACAPDKSSSHSRNEASIKARDYAAANTKEVSKHFTKCHICRQTIPWIDLNTHVPSCASAAGKCSRCGELVPSCDLKKHMFQKCKMLSAKHSLVDETNFNSGMTSRNGVDYHAEEDRKPEYQVCPYCSQMCDTDRIEEHVKNCSENYFECPLCTEKVLERDKVRHESFQCKVLLDINAEENYGIKSGSKHNQRTEHLPGLSYGPSAPAESYASAARKPAFEGKKGKTSPECKPCCPCYTNPKRKKEEHSLTCQRFQKSNCVYCDEEILVSLEDTHLKTCKKFLAFQDFESRPVNQNNHKNKGAVPKHSKFSDMVKPMTGKCKFCHTTLNADILIYHEKECIYQPQQCKCGASIPMKDFTEHRCKKRERGNQGKKEKTEQTAPEKSSYGSRFARFLGISEQNDGSVSTTKGKLEYSSNSSVHSKYSYNEGPSSYFEEDVKIPCEFCEKLISANELVEHETGCKPELVSYAKKNFPENKEVLIQYNTPYTISGGFFSTERRNVSSSSTRLATAKKEAASAIKPGEFLQGHSAGTETAKEHLQSELENKYSKPSRIQSVWNYSSSTYQEETMDTKALLDNSHCERVLDHEKESNEKISDEIEKMDSKSLLDNSYHKNVCDHEKERGKISDELIMTDSEVLMDNSYYKRVFDHGKESVENISDEVKKSTIDGHTVNSDEEMAELLEFINDKKTDVYSESYCEESTKPIYQKYAMDSDPLVPSGGHEYPSSATSIETKKCLIEMDVEKFSVETLKHCLPDSTSEKNVDNKAFFLEPAQDHWRRDTPIGGNDVRSSNPNIQGYLRQNASDQSHSEIPDEDIEKWEKWQKRAYNIS